MNILLGILMLSPNWDDPPPTASGYFSDDYANNRWPLIFLGAVAAAILGWAVVYVLHRLLPRPQVSATCDSKASGQTIEVVAPFAGAGGVLACLVFTVFVLATMDRPGHPTSPWDGVEVPIFLGYIVSTLAGAGWGTALGQAVACVVRWRHANRPPVASIPSMRQPHECEPGATVPADAVQDQPDDGRFTR